MTQDFSTEYQAAASLSGSGIATSAHTPFQAQQWFRVRGPWDAKGVLVHECRVTDLRNGWQQFADSIGTASSTLDQRFYRSLILPPLVNTTTLSATQNYSDIENAHFGSTRQLAMANGGTNNLALFKETSATDPIPVAVAYSPGSTTPIISLSAGVIGGASTAEQLFIGRINAATEVLSDLAPTSSGTMHANTAYMWDMLLSPINASTPGTGTLLIYAGSGSATMYTLPISSAIGTAPTAVMTGLPGGGNAMGIEQLQKQSALRAFWRFPLQASTQSIFAGSVLLPFAIVSTNLEGTDPQVIPLGLDRIYFSELWNQTIVATDGPRVVSFDGQNKRDLHFLRGRARNTSLRFDCIGLRDYSGGLYALVMRSDLAVASPTIGNAVLTVERYLPEFDSWVPVTGTITIDDYVDSTDKSSPLGQADLPYKWGSMPVSKKTGMMHLLSGVGTKWRRFFLSPEGVNPYEHYSMTGSTAYIAQQFAASGVWTSNVTRIPRYESGITYPPGNGRYPSVVYAVDVQEADLDAGGAASTVKFEFATQTGATLDFTNPLSHTFGPGDSIAGRTHLFMENKSAVDRFQMRVTITQGASTYQTLNALPFTFRVMTFLDGVVRSPASVLGGN